MKVSAVNAKLTCKDHTKIIILVTSDMREDFTFDVTVNNQHFDVSVTQMQLIPGGLLGKLDSYLVRGNTVDKTTSVKKGDILCCQYSHVFADELFISVHLEKIDLEKNILVDIADLHRDSVVENFLFFNLSPFTSTQFRACIDNKAGTFCSLPMNNAEYPDLIPHLEQEQGDLYIVLHPQVKPSAVMKIKQNA